MAAIRFVELARNGINPVFDSRSIRIGRKDREHPEDVPDVNLELDMQVTRILHCRLYFKDGKWFVADCGSRNGTFVNGRRIENGAEIAVDYGTPVCTGNTSWLILPAEWLFVRHGGVIIYGYADNILSYARYHCGKKNFDRLVIKNTGKSRSKKLIIRFECGGYFIPAELNIRELGINEEITVDVPERLINVHILKKQKEAARTYMKVEIISIGEKSTYAGEMFVLGSRDLLFEKDSWHILAAYVSPSDRLAKGIVKGAEAVLRDSTEYGSYNGILRSGDPQTEVCLLKAVYDYLSMNNDISYKKPDLRYIEGTGIRYQKIGRINSRMHKDGETAEGDATCLDLALIFASCLENIGLCPLVFLMGDSQGAPLHAFAGCWTGASPGLRPLIYDTGYIENEISAGHILPVECTGITGLNGVSNFEEAVASAKGQYKKGGMGLRRGYWRAAPSLRPDHPDGLCL